MIRIEAAQTGIEAAQTGSGRQRERCGARTHSGSNTAGRWRHCQPRCSGSHRRGKAPSRRCTRLYFGLRLLASAVRKSVSKQASPQWRWRTVLQIQGPINRVVKHKVVARVGRDENLSGVIAHYPIPVRVCVPKSAAVRRTAPSISGRGKLRHAAWRVGSRQQRTCLNGNGIRGRVVRLNCVVACVGPHEDAPCCLVPLDDIAVHCAIGQNEISGGSVVFDVIVLPAAAMEANQPPRSCGDRFRR